MKETEPASLGIKSPRIGLDKLTCAEQRRKNHKESISQHFFLITASERWILKLPSGITPFLNCVSVPRAWQGLISFMSSPWITPLDWIISEHPMATKASVYEREAALELYLCAHYSSETHTGSWPLYSHMCISVGFNKIPSVPPVQKHPKLSQRPRQSPFLPLPQHPQHVLKSCSPLPSAATCLPNPGIYTILECFASSLD